LEQSRRRAVLLAALIVAIGGAVSAAVLFRPRPERVVGHAFPVPAVGERVVVEVLNGTARQGLARTATRMLRRQGIDVVFLGNADAAAESTQVLVRRGDPGRGALVARALGGGIVRVALDTLRRVDVSVILGQDFRPRIPLHP
jgi:hypothetical protein